MSEFVITESNYEKEVLFSEKPVLMDFWATWCGPCQMLSPIISEIAEEHPEIKVCKVNVDENPTLADEFGVSSIPMVVVMKNGEITNSMIGYRPKSDIEKLIK